MNFLFKRLLPWIGRRLDGYKTKIGGVGLILAGLVGLLSLIFPDQGLPPGNFETAVTAIASGFAVLGLGGKAEKLKSAIVQSAPPQ